MDFYLKIGLGLVVAEVLRRLIMVLITGLTSPLTKVPGPFLTRFTILGWFMDVLKGEQHYKADSLIAKYGPVVRFGPNSILVANTAAVRKVLLEADLPKALIYEKMRPHPSIGTLFTERDKTKYKAARRLLSGGFSISYLNGLEPLMQDCMRVFEQFLDSQCANAGKEIAVVDFSLALSNLTFDILSATAFGGSFNMVTTNDIAIKEDITQLFQRQAINMILPWLKYLPFVPPAQSPRLAKLTNEIIATRKAEMAAKKKVKRDILQIILDAHEADPVAIPYQRISDEMNTFMAAGTDTSSYTATCSLMLLLNNPSKLQRLIDELDTAFPSLQTPITFADTQDLPYLNAVINETSRICPVIIGGVARWTTENIEIDGYIIPPEVEIVTYLSAVMKNPTTWPDAEEFIPERWLGAYKGVEVDRASFIPFSIGSRNCIGQHFAMKELRLIVATIVRRYELSLIPGQSHRFHWRITAEFTQGYYNVGVKPRV